MRRSIALLVFVIVALPALGDGAPPSAPLNDTGQTKCRDGGSLVDCAAANTGDASDRPRQDGRFGRDAAAAAGLLAKIGGGAAGFDFTPLDAAGVAIPLTGTPPVPSATPACVRDKVTGLIWEVKTLANMNATYSLSDATAVHAAAVNAAPLCGFTDWRLPTRRELLSIVHYGASGPAIDTAYFPNTASAWYWSGNTKGAAFAWYVDFNDGNVNAFNQDFTFHVRLVRSGQ